MLFSVKDFRKVEAAAIELRSITVLAGMNGQGKTSLAQALGALLTRKPFVFNNMLKRDAVHLVTDGAKHASATLHGDDGAKVTISWPDMAVTEDGKAPSASPIACGQQRFAQLNPDDMAALLIETLGAKPTKEEFVKATNELMGVDGQEEIWTKVVTAGWTEAAEYIGESTKQLKGQWQAVTHEAWGSKKAVEWKPPGFQGDPLDTGEKDLLDEISRSQTEYEHAISTKAVDEERRRQLESESGTLDTLLENLTTLTNELQEVEVLIAEVTETLAALPTASGGGGFPCPHCGGIIEKKPVSGGFQYIQAPIVAEKDLKATRITAANLEGMLARHKDGKTLKERERAVLNQRIGSAKKAREEFESIKGGTDDRPATAESAVVMFRTRLEKNRQRLEDYRSWKRAHDIHTRISKGLAIAEMLHPDGLRYRKLMNKLEDFNKMLSAGSVKLGLAELYIDQTLTIWCGERQYRFLSKSQQFRADVVFQLVLAGIDGSAAIIVDGADIVTGGKDRGALLTLLLEAGIPALMCISLTSPESIPPVGEHGGHAYWLEHGTAHRVGRR